jgi:hypothetical protein
MIPRSLAFVLLLLVSCKGESLATEWCSALTTEPNDTITEPNWKEHIEPLVKQKCLGCHTPGGLAPLDLSDFATFSAAKASIRNAVESRRMPPFLADGCCTSYLGDRSLSPEEIQRVTRFIDQGLPEGDPANAPPTEATMTLLSRVDVTIKMPAPYTPKPPDPDSTDDNRCFALQWPEAQDGFITGMSPRPGNRKLVHHLVVAALEGDDAADALARDLADPLPGFDCNGGLGRFQKANVIGGAVVGSDLPRGLGSAVKQGGVILLNIHYSVARVTSPESDLTEIDFKFDTQARESKGIAIANPAWLVADAMKVQPGDPDEPFFYIMRADLFTRAKRVELHGVTPHMHHFGKQITVRIIKPDGTQKCLLEIPHWEFGWEQPFWFKESIVFEKDDRLYLECRFDNSAANQPFGRAPRDFAWGGNDQDMCAAFLSFTEAP